MKYGRSSIWVIRGLIAIAFACAVPQANAFVIVSSGVATMRMSPSADTLTLGASSVTTAALGMFNLQNGVFTVGNSGALTGTFNFNINENVTINGETHALVLSAEDIVGINNDTVMIFPSSPLVFSSSNVALTTLLLSLATTAQTNNFTLEGKLNTVPEPSTLGLLGTALAGLAIALRRRGRRGGFATA